MTLDFLCIVATGLPEYGDYLCPTHDALEPSDVGVEGIADMSVIGKYGAEEE